MTFISAACSIRHANFQHSGWPSRSHRASVMTRPSKTAAGDRARKRHRHDDEAHRRPAAPSLPEPPTGVASATPAIRLRQSSAALRDASSTSNPVQLREVDLRAGASPDSASTSPRRTQIATKGIRQRAAALASRCLGFARTTGSVKLVIRAAGPQPVPSRTRFRPRAQPVEISSTMAPEPMRGSHISACNEVVASTRPVP